jgi:hypothetical protein
MKLTNNQQILINYLNEGNKLIQKNNRLWLNDEVLHTRTFVALMFKLYKNEYLLKMKQFVIIENN